MSDLDYDRLSPEFDERYRVNPLAGVERAIGRLVDTARPRLCLEVGCGTGRWLPLLAGAGGQAVGVDLFPGMLARVPRIRMHPRLVCAGGDKLPFAGPTFDLVASINALHHLDDPSGFIHRSAGYLRPGGRLALVHYDPGRADQSWYVYDDFAETRGGDLERFPREAQIADWMRQAGLEEFDSEVAETIERHYVGRAVLEDHFLGRHSNSTLARLGDADYKAGLAALQQRIELAETSGEVLRFDVRLELLLLTGRKN